MFPALTPTCALRAHGLFTNRAIGVRIAYELCSGGAVPGAAQLVALWGT